MVASAVEVMNENVRMIEKLDFIFSKGKLSADLDCTEPMINTERRIVLKDARHPLMNKEVNVPLQFEIGTNARMTFDKETLRPTYRMVIGEAGQSCAFYIADRLGMPNEMLRSAIRAAYGEEAVGAYHFQKEDTVIGKKAGSRTLSGGL